MAATVTEQGALTIIVEIAPGRADDLEKLLIPIGDTVDEPQCRIDFSRFTTVHFMRWVVLPEAKDEYGLTIPAQLVLSTNYDLPLETHLQELVEKTGATLRDIYRHCKDYPGDNADLLPYFRRHMVNYAAFYCGTRGRSVAQIRNEQQLRTAIQGVATTRLP